MMPSHSLFAVPALAIISRAPATFSNCATRQSSTASGSSNTLRRLQSRGRNGWRMSGDRCPMGRKNVQPRCALLGRPDGRLFPDRKSPGINETPARMGLVGASIGGTNDADTSLPSPVADNARLDRQDQARTYPLTGSASSPSNRLGALRCRRPRKSPSLKAKIKEQLRQKHVRFLADTSPNDIGLYWAACLGDDATEGQRMFDAVDRRMRAVDWDDMRQWKHQNGIAA